MRYKDKKLFTNKRKLIEMLNMRVSGYSISALAVLYKCDGSSIRYQCDKYKIEPPDDEVYAVDRIIMQVIPKAVGHWKVVNGERVNIGKSYKEYLLESGVKYPPKIWQ